MTAPTNGRGIEYDTGLAENFIMLIAEFFGIPESEARKNLDLEFRHPGALVAESWRAAKPRTRDEIARFYRETQSYVYDLAADHCNFRRRPVGAATIQRLGRRGRSQNVLVYGDGIGEDSIAIARCGHRVTYFDLPGVTSAFARFRFEKESILRQIILIDKETDIPAESYDAVICIEVLEHVPDPPSLMKKLHSALKVGGIALITESFDSIGDDFPSHLPANFQYAGRTHQLMEKIGFANTYYNIDPVNRPMEFTKVGNGLPGELFKIQGKLRRAIGSRWRRISRIAGQTVYDQ